MRSPVAASTSRTSSRGRAAARRSTSTSTAKATATIPPSLRPSPRWPAPRSTSWCSTTRRCRGFRATSPSWIWWASNTLAAGAALESDHPGFSDQSYRSRRAEIERIARAYRHGDPLAVIDYTAAESRTWGKVYRRLAPSRERYACAAYLDAFRALERSVGFGPDEIPQSHALSDFLKGRTGFALRPAAGLLRPRDFLNALAFRVFFATQYVRHHSVPFYTPEPDVCHELLGHAPMFADPGLRGPFAGNRPGKPRCERRRHRAPDTLLLVFGGSLG